MSMSKFRLMIWDYTNCEEDDDPEEIETFFEHKIDTKEDFDDLIKMVRSYNEDQYVELYIQFPDGTESLFAVNSKGFIFDNTEDDPICYEDEYRKIKMYVDDREELVCEIYYNDPSIAMLDLKDGIPNVSEDLRQKYPCIGNRYPFIYYKVNINFNYTFDKPKEK